MHSERGSFVSLKGQEKADSHIFLLIASLVYSFIYFIPSGYLYCFSLCLSALFLYFSLIFSTCVYLNAL